MAVQPAPTDKPPVLVLEPICKSFGAVRALPGQTHQVQSILRLGGLEDRIPWPG